MISTATLIALLGIGITDGPTGPDTVKLEFFERCAVSKAENATHRLFRAVDDVTDYRNGTGEQDLELRCPVVEDTMPAVYINNGASWGSPIAASLYEVRQHPQLGIRNILHLLGATWPYGGNGNIRVDYEGGYEAGDDEGDLLAPGDIRLLVARVTSLLFNTQPVTTSASGASPVTADVELPDDLQAIVERWRLGPGVYALPLLRTG
jgi:hypothetical protein